jgi:hypothetical protein
MSEAQHVLGCKASPAKMVAIGDPAASGVLPHPMLRVCTV